MSDPRPPQDEDYSATVLGSHWFSGPAETAGPAAPAAPAVSVGPAAPAEVAPDRVDGSVLRFGPGVTAALPAPFPVAAAAPPRRRRGGGLRRYALAACVLLAVLGYLGWQRLSPTVGVRDLAVTTDPAGPTCDTTADVVAVVKTDGRPGTLTYRWVRSDGTRSEELTERVPRGRHEARLHLLWTFRGAGSHRARAELHLVSPERRTAAVDFTYSCRP
ncbi:hypothetical protein [Streptomyces sp. cmx-4-9]|uniref:hypothetical protein n=1 Tax=Streptomyces sp. cmx-4-9 TaxID=2790941 RepID=UPI00397F6AAE